MKEIFKQASLGCRAAIDDFTQNILHPVRNLKIAFGLSEEDSFQEMIRKTAQKKTAEDLKKQNSPNNRNKPSFFGS